MRKLPYGSYIFDGDEDEVSWFWAVISELSFMGMVKVWWYWFTKHKGEK